MHGVTFLLAKILFILYFQEQIIEAEMPFIFIADTFVTQVKATDYDDPLEVGHASVSYAIEKNVIDEDSGKPIFAIEPASGK